LVTVATLVGTILLYIYVPKGFFPVQDTGVILGVSEGAQDISFAAMAQRQRDLAGVILNDPAVESLSSFIGIDGTNTTLNSGRIQINLKPLADRGIKASAPIRRPLRHNRQLRHPPHAGPARHLLRHHPLHAAGDVGELDLQAADEVAGVDAAVG